jgi:RNA polymerase sigma factor (sigma-70 family)
MDSPTGWTFVVARNVLRLRTRAKRREEFVADPRQHEQASPDPAEAVSSAIAMAQILASLTRRQRTMFVLHYGMDVSQDHVASLMHVSRSTVASTLMDVRRLLQGDQTPRRVGRRRGRQSTDIVLKKEETKNA